jgi:hypothetical protein
MLFKLFISSFACLSGNYVSENEEYNEWKSQIFGEFHDVPTYKQDRSNLSKDKDNFQEDMNKALTHCVNDGKS